MAINRPAGPEPLWRQARERFADLGDDLWVARASLDLARFCLAVGRPGEATAVASELASTLGAAAAGPEDTAALEPLGRAAPFTEVASDDLDRAEAVLKRLEWGRRADRALDLAGSSRRPDSPPTSFATATRPVTAGSSRCPATGSKSPDPPDRKPVPS